MSSERLSFDVQYQITRIAFNCLACGKALTIEKRSSDVIMSGTFCTCAGSPQYFITWDDKVLRYMEGFVASISEANHE